MKLGGLSLQVYKYKLQIILQNLIIFTHINKTGRHLTPQYVVYKPALRLQASSNLCAAFFLKFSYGLPVFLFWGLVFAFL